jgi:hypothetical protein
MAKFIVNRYEEPTWLIVKARFFPSSMTSPNFDTAIEVNHSYNERREQFGVPLKIRTWIKKNPCSTPKAQRENVLRAIAAGEIPGVSTKKLNGPNIHYW